METENLEKLEGPGPAWGARANPACRGQSSQPGPVLPASANPICPGQPGQPEPVQPARANLGCQGQSGVPGPVQGARASPGCQSQSGVPRPVWGTKASQTCVLNHGCEPNCLCNSMCCAMLLHSNRSALVYIYIYILDAQVAPYGCNLRSTFLIWDTARFGHGT